MKPVALSFLLLLSGFRLFATPQSGDTLRTGDEELYVHGFTLSGELLNQVFEFKINQIKLRKSLILINSGNHKGFYAALVLEGGKLYVEKLWIDGASMATDERLPVPFRKADDAEPLFASWFTGDLRHFYGEQLPGYVTEHTHQRVFSFWKGRLISITRGETEQHVRFKNRTNSVLLGNPPSEGKPASQSESQTVINGVPQNVDIANLTQKAEGGGVQAQAWLAMCLYDGRHGVATNYVDAYKWASVVAAREQKNAKHLVEELELFMTPEQIKEGSGAAQAFLETSKDKSN